MNYEKKYKEYECIGEIGLTLNSKVMAGVVAYTEVKAFYLDIKGYEIVFASLLDSVKDKIKYFADFFPNIKFDEVKRASFLFEEKKFKIDEIIYSQGEFPHYMYFIKTGEVHVSEKRGEGIE